MTHGQSPGPSLLYRPVCQLASLAALFAAHIKWIVGSTAAATCPRYLARLLHCRPMMRLDGEFLASAVVLMLTGMRMVSAHQRGRRLLSALELPWAQKISVSGRQLAETTCNLAVVYLLSGHIGDLWRCVLASAAAMGLPLTASAVAALQIFGTHMAWACMAFYVLGQRLKPFFPPPLGDGKWFRCHWRGDWLQWSVGGFYASIATYDAVDSLAHRAFPAPTTMDVESVVSTLAVRPASDPLAFITGAAGPCFTAPVFEEVLYRGFVLPALCRFLPIATALPLQALLFGLHHGSLMLLLPLSALGFLWSVLYIGSGNLLVPILVHASECIPCMVAVMGMTATFPGVGHGLN